MNTKLTSLLKDIGGIILLSVVLGFTYNYYSAKGVSIIRSEKPKETIPDSVLFSSSPAVTQEQPIVEDSSKKQKPVSLDTIKKKPVLNKKPLQQQGEDESHPALGYKIISFDQFARIVKEKKGMIIDAREPDEYKEGHVPGAINIPYETVDSYFDKLVDIPRDTFITIYCSNLMCPLGRGLAEFMVQLEFRKLVLFDDGWDLWQRESMPEEK